MASRHAWSVVHATHVIMRQQQRTCLLFSNSYHCVVVDGKFHSRYSERTNLVSIGGGTISYNDCDRRSIKRTFPGLIWTMRHAFSNDSDDKRDRYRCHAW